MAESRRKFDQDFKEGAVRLAARLGTRSRRSRRTWGSIRARWRTGQNDRGIHPRGETLTSP
jgi:transposase-like protein